MRLWESGNQAVLPTVHSQCLLRHHQIYEGSRDWNCWPVSLLCTDYKLLSKVLANRLKKVMDQVIHQTQTYSVPGRSIVDNVSLIGGL